MASKSLVMCALLMSGCAANAKPVASVPTQAEEPARVAPSRDLAAVATFEDVVAGIAAEELRESVPQRCLLARTGDGYRLEAELAIAVHPVAAPPEDLDATLPSVSTVRALSRWGRHGLSAGPLTVAALTDTPPTRLAWALVLTDRGFYLRPTDGIHALQLHAAPDAELGTQLRAASALGTDVTMFVTAERSVPVARLASVLSVLGALHRGPVALALALSPDTALPAPRSASAAALRCPSGLPESTDVEGDLSVGALNQALVPLRERAAICLGAADARGAAGGRLLLGLRIRADGAVAQACMISDETEDDALAACVLAAARDLPFPAPVPTGSVDVELPLLLRPNSAPAQPPVCGATQPAQDSAH